MSLVSIVVVEGGEVGGGGGGTDGLQSHGAE